MKEVARYLGMISAHCNDHENIQRTKSFALRFAALCMKAHWALQELFRVGGSGDGPIAFRSKESLKNVFSLHFQDLLLVGVLEIRLHSFRLTCCELKESVFHVMKRVRREWSNHTSSVFFTTFIKHHCVSKLTNLSERMPSQQRAAARSQSKISKLEGGIVPEADRALGSKHLAVVDFTPEEVDTPEMRAMLAHAHADAAIASAAGLGLIIEEIGAAWTKTKSGRMCKGLRFHCNGEAEKCTFVRKYCLTQDTRRSMRSDQIKVAKEYYNRSGASVHFVGYEYAQVAFAALLNDARPEELVKELTDKVTAARNAPVRKKKMRKQSAAKTAAAKEFYEARRELRRFEIDCKPSLDLIAEIGADTVKEKNASGKPMRQAKARS